MNNCSFVGRLTASPELKVTPNGKNVCNFTLAVERKIKGAGGEKIADYIDFVAWNHNADFLCKWFDKGVRVAVTGELQTRLYEKDGKKNKVSEILVNTVEFADGKRDADNNTFTPINEDNVTSFDTDAFMPIDAEEDLPFL